MALKKPYITPEEYLAMERASETKHEYYRGEVYEWGSVPTPPIEIFPNRLILTGNIFASLHAQLRKSPATIYQTGMRVKSGKNYGYPDVVVAWDKAEYEDDSLLNPTVILEISLNWGAKFDVYRSIASLQEYLVVSHDEIHIEHYRRADKGWLLSDADTLDAVITLPTIECTLLLDDVYEKVRFDELSSDSNPSLNS